MLAIIQADANRYAGANKCLLWQAFAKRGLGSGKSIVQLFLPYHFD
jgi:extracellular elastinolytic metalloproteinase